MGGKIIIVLACVFLLGIVIYAVNSNVVGKLGSPFGSLFHYGSSSWAITSPATFSSPSAGTQITAAAPPTPAINRAEIPAGFTLTELSPYFKKIMFSGVSAGTPYSYGTITLSTYGLAASDTVDVTGWQIKTNRSGEYIPQAIDLYDPSGLSSPSDIFVGQGQYVYIYFHRGRSTCD